MFPRKKIILHWLASVNFGKVYGLLPCPHRMKSLEAPGSIRRTSSERLSAPLGLLVAWGIGVMCHLSLDRSLRSHVRAESLDRFIDSFLTQSIENLPKQI